MWNLLHGARQGRGIPVVWIILWCYASLSLQQRRDPISNFCRRWGHQSAIVDEKLYIDGGLVTFSPSDGTPQNVTSKSASLASRPQSRTIRRRAIAAISTNGLTMFNRQY